MDKNERLNREYYTIDLMHIAKTLWQRIWIVILAGILAAAVGFSISTFVIKPEYSSSVMLYVNNSSFSLGNTSFSISSSEITAAQSLVKTYSEILNNRTTLNMVIDEIGLDYTYGELSGMVTATQANDTEIMKVTVTTNDPRESAEIANCIARVLPIRIAQIIDGASMEVVDDAVPNNEKVAPSITKYTAVGMVLGVLISALAIVLAAMMDDTIHNEEYILQAYNYPILAKVPDLLDSGNKKYGYRRYGKYSYYGSDKKKSAK